MVREDELFNFVVLVICSGRVMQNVIGRCDSQVVESKSCVEKNNDSRILSLESRFQILVIVNIHVEMKLRILFKKVKQQHIH